MVDMSLFVLLGRFLEKAIDTRNGHRVVARHLPQREDFDLPQVIARRRRGLRLVDRDQLKFWMGRGHRVPDAISIPNPRFRVARPAISATAPSGVAGAIVTFYGSTAPAFPPPSPGNHGSLWYFLTYTLNYWLVHLSCGHPWRHNHPAHRSSVSPSAPTRYPATG